MQRIIVKNFGPLKDIDLEIKDYMIFLGPQASGKSTLAKLIYGFKDIFSKAINERLWEYHVSIKNIFTLKLNSIDWEYFIIDYFYPTIQNYNNYKIEFLFHKLISVSVLNNNGEIKVKFSDALNEVFFKIKSEIEDEIPKLNEVYITDLYTDIGHLELVIDEKIVEKLRHYIPMPRLLFIPDERNINETNQNSHFINVVKRNRVFFKEGFNSFEVFVKNTSQIFDERKFSIVKTYFTKILKGDYENIDGGKILLRDGTKIPLDLASSGQKEVIGILLILAHEILRKLLDCYIIEEPEAHLFPEAQKDITYLISLLANQERNNVKNQVIITTHSHYILGALNILINAHRIGQTNPEEVEKIVPKELWVDKNRIFAGFLENGIIKDIYDDEAEMIKIQQLNAVAGEINKDFDRLLDLEFANENV